MGEEKVERVLRCSKCGKVIKEDEDMIYYCDSCGPAGTLDVLYDMHDMRKRIDRGYFNDNKEHSIWRYLPLLPLESRKGRAPLQVGWTPLYRAERLEQEMGIKEIYVKDDGRNPTGSLKDRATAVGIAKAVELEKNVICAASTGNAASSLAGFAACMGMKNYIFVPSTAPEAKIAQLLIYGSQLVLVDGSYDEAFQLCLKASEHFGWYNRSCAINPYLVEGKKTVAFEICEQLNFKVPDKVIMAVGDGCSLSAAWKGFKELHELGMIDSLPQMVSVQAEGANAVNSTYRRGDRAFRHEKANTIADSICVGVPRNGYKALNALGESRGLTVDASDRDILDAIKLMARTTGVFGEPAGVTGLAGLVKLVRNNMIKPNESVALVVSGNGLKDVKTAMKTVQVPAKIKPQLYELIKVMGGKENVE